ncbi:hypothetical protein BC941DRAFT_469236 [Chlamydoabsidia padenii]|nr:hypothetical protein BC941DRAFT_469236 [Chlamydoabsidia padenii]
MDESKQNGHKDILLDRRQLDQVMKSINKQASHERYHYSDSKHPLHVEIDEFFGYVELSILLPHLSSRKKADGDIKGLSLTAWIEQLLDRLESRSDQRKQAAEHLLYIALGEFDQWTGDNKGPLDRMIKNNCLLYDIGVFYAIQQTMKHACNQLFNSSDVEEALLVEIDLYLTLTYLILETNRQQGRFEKDTLDTDFVEYLFDILARLKDNFVQSFPVKKSLLVTFGDLEKAQSLKDDDRKKHGLAPLEKSQIVKCSQRDLLTFQNDFISRYPAYTPPINLSSPLDKVSPLTVKATPALAAAMGISTATSQTTLPYQVLFPPKQPKGSDNKQAGINAQTNGVAVNTEDPWNSSQTVVLPLSESGPCVPASLNEASAIYQKYMQLSLADYQIIMERQRAIQKWQDLEHNGREDTLVEKIGSLSIGRTAHNNSDNCRSDDIYSKIEHFYTSTVPELQSNVIVLLKQLLTTAATKPKTPGKNGQQKQQGIPTMESADIDRNREILCKSISAILLLLLKWFKVSHVLKFEYFSQLLVDSGCMLLILKIFGLQEIGVLTSTKTDMDSYSLFQQIASLQSNGSVYSSPPASPLSSHSNESHYTNERNIFWIINLLRTLQKLSKGKMHRIMLLVQYKSSAIFKRVHKISHPMVELYALKNLKNQIPYLGRKWRSVNMKMISAIYFCCPPDLRDDWLITRNDKEGDLEEGKMEEINLRILIRLYHGQRYIDKLLPEDDSKHGDYSNDVGPFSASLVLDRDIPEDITLDETFETDYRDWLEKEVYSKNDDNDDDDNGNNEDQSPTTDWSIGTPIPTTEHTSSISPTLLAQEINKLYHEELNREFNLSKETTSGWDAPIVLTNVLGERLQVEDEDDEDDEDDDKQMDPTDPLGNVDWNNLSEEELAKRLALVEENTVRRWMSVDIDDPQYIKVLNTFENVEEDPMNDVWGAVDPSLETWS